MDTMFLIGFVAILLLLLIAVQGRQQKKRLLQKLKTQLRDEYGQSPFPMPLRSQQIPIDQRYAQDTAWIDDLTWKDLDMDQVFLRLNYTRSSAGHEMLYHMLRKPVFQEEELKKREELIETLQKQEKQREELALLFSTIGSTGKYALSEYLNKLEQAPESSLKKHIFLDLLYLPALVLLVKYPLAGLCSLFVLFFLSVTDYFREKARWNPYLVSFAYILRMLSFSRHLQKVSSTSLEPYQELLKQAGQRLAPLEVCSGVVMSMNDPLGSSNPFSLLLDYVNILFHFNLMKIITMFQLVNREKEVIRNMVDTIGYLDACLSIVYYRASLKQYCIPKWQQEYVQAQEVYHPLLQEPVKNDIQIRKNILLTGSNASGKSTFLRTLGIQVIFAQTICTCNADKLRLPFMKVLSSMAVRDNLQTGDSYYMAEIKSVKRILDDCRKGEYQVFCLIDEVLRGTNTIERIAASCEILKSLSGPAVLCVAATHDIELTDLLREEYEDFHFQEEIENQDVKFSYKLKKGKATSRNAIRLLQVMGFEEKIVQKADQRAKDFLETGEWKE